MEGIVIHVEQEENVTDIKHWMQYLYTTGGITIDGGEGTGREYNWKEATNWKSLKYSKLL